MSEGESETAANRRWLIGLSITVLFGVFGAVMAFLAYSDRGDRGDSRQAPGSSPTSKPTTEPASPAPSDPVPAPDHKGKGHKDN